MISQFHLHIPSMNCNGCLRTISNAIIEADQTAVISEGDLDKKTINVKTILTLDKLSETLADIGHEIESCISKQVA